MTTKRCPFLAIACAVLASIATALGDDSGKVCIQTIPSGPASNWQANQTGASERSVFTIRIDKLPPIRVTTNSSGVFTNLSLTEKHVVSIRLDGKPSASFKFSFEGGSGHRVLWYNEFYGTWSMWDVKPGDKCACPKP